MPLLTEDIHNELKSKGYKYACIIDFSTIDGKPTLTIKPLKSTSTGHNGYSITSINDAMIKEPIENEDKNTIVRYSF